MRLIVADDSLLFREGLARVLTEAGFDVIGQAADADELRQLVAADPPDVAIIDIRMPPTHTTEGITAASELGRAFPMVRSLVLSQHVEAHYALRLIDEVHAGAGYVLKDHVSDLDQFLESVRRVGEGETVIDPAIVSLLVGRHRGEDRIATLSEREREVLELMAEGRSNQAIADRLFVSVKTIEAHVGSIFTRLGLEPTADDHRRVLAVLTYLRS